MDWYVRLSLHHGQIVVHSLFYLCSYTLNYPSFTNIMAILMTKHTAGKNVANGYLNRPAENSKHFSTDTFAGDDSRLYKTGDLCKRLPDGRIQFIGRRDNQIKLNVSCYYAPVLFCYCIDTDKIF